MDESIIVDGSVIVDRSMIVDGVIRVDRSIIAAESLHLLASGHPTFDPAHLPVSPQESNLIESTSHVSSSLCKVPDIHVAVPANDFKLPLTMT